ncbi:hypothetical protein ACFL5E_02885 [Candidatus Omnitrophota bacterium]
MLHSETVLAPLQKGMCYVTWDRHRFASQYSDESIEKLASLGVEYLSICITHYQESFNSTRIKRTDQTPSKRSIKHVIRRAHKLGMKVMLKPHIDLIDKYDGTYWRADIGFTIEKDWKIWFEEYQEFIVSYARLARQMNVELLCVGTELSFTTQKDDEWRKIIAEIRKVYPGEIVYAANWDNYKNIRFWDQLDYIGIDAYFPLTYTQDPSVADLKKGWEKWRHEIELWQKQINKPVIFTEIGYPSSSHAPYTPWKSGMNGNANPEIQAKCYKAFFETMWDQPWLAGVYWWKWDTNTSAGGNYNRQFTPQNKPAQRILEAHYKGYGRAMYALADSGE